MCHVLLQYVTGSEGSPAPGHILVLYRSVFAIQLRRLLRSLYWVVRSQLKAFTILAWRRSQCLPRCFLNVCGLRDRPT